MTVTHDKSLEARIHAGLQPLVDQLAGKPAKPVKAGGKPAKGVKAGGTPVKSKSAKAVPAKKPVSASPITDKLKQEALAETQPATPPAAADPPWGTIAHALINSVRVRYDGESVAKYTAALAKQSHTTQIQSNLVRIKMVQALTVPKREAGKKNVEAWQKAQAERLGLQHRMIKYLLAAAKAMNQWATELPVDFLDRPIAWVARDAKLKIVKGIDPDAVEADKPAPVKKTAVERVQAELDKVKAAYLNANPADSEAIGTLIVQLLSDINYNPTKAD